GNFEHSIITILKSRYQEAYQSMIARLLCYDSIGFSCYKSNFMATQEIALILKKNKPDLRIILGGPEITACYFKFQEGLTMQFNDFADFIVVGEGERPLSDYLTKKNASSSIALFQEIDDLENTGGPDFSDFDLNTYLKKAALPLMLSRGCIKKCRFCAERLLYKKFRPHAIPAIIQQINYFKDQNINTFIFHDSLINGNLVWLDSLCEALIENFGSIPWEAQCAIRNDMPEELLEKIRRSGCYHLFVGLESGCSRTLKNMNKGYNALEAREFFKRLNKAGLSFGISILVGFPGETREDFEESLQFVINNKELIPKIEQVNPFVYYEGIHCQEASDYKSNPELLERAQCFIKKIKEKGIKHTNAFLLNLVEPQWK
ncbi:MAG: B12-binding domain-containing radical SAM protein, partial [bacterium]